MKRADYTAELVKHRHVVASRMRERSRLGQRAVTTNTYELMLLGLLIDQAPFLTRAERADIIANLADRHV